MTVYYRLFYFLWQIAKAWLDPVTANKFVLLPPNQLDKLKVLLHTYTYTQCANGRVFPRLNKVEWSNCLFVKDF